LINEGVIKPLNTVKHLACAAIIVSGLAAMAAMFAGLAWLARHSEIFNF